MYLRNILFAVGLIALIAGFALAGLWLWESGSTQGTAADGLRPPITILVAAAEIRPGTLLRAEDMAWKAVAATKVPPAAIPQQPGAEKILLGAVARRSFAAGEPLVPGGVVKPGDRGFLASVLSPGMRAVAISVDASSSTAGLIQPGDYVDVLLAQNVAGDTTGRNVVGETVLQNVRVIAVDQWFAAEGKPASGAAPITAVESRVPKTITLEVDEENAKRLLVATQLGKVTLAMRALEGAYAVPERAAGDTEPVWATDVSSALGGRGQSPARAAAGPPAGAGRGSVIIIRGSNIQVQ